MRKSHKTTEHHPWRENIEGLALAIIMALTLKYFVLEAYKIPTGSMQPTLMGIDQKNLQIFDRILVDKMVYQYREPRRWEVVVFRYPLDQSKNYIKRLIGLPGETLRIHRGDIYIRQPRAKDFHIMRKPKEVQEALWREVFDVQDVETGAMPLSAFWKEEQGTWRFLGHDMIAQGPSSVSFTEVIQNEYAHGYPKAIRNIMENSPAKRAGYQMVGDIRIAFAVLVQADCSAIYGLLEQSNDHYKFEIGGPSGKQEAAIFYNEQKVAAQPLQLSANTKTAISFAHVDRELILEIDGHVILQTELPADVYDYNLKSGQNHLQIGTQGAGATFSNTKIFRDIYFVQSGTEDEWVIPAEHYFFLGDNTSNSYDSRLWREVTYVIDDKLAPGVPQFLRGDGGATDQNPRHVPINGRGMFLELVDIFGEKYLFREDAEKNAPLEHAQPFVARKHLLGRAIFVFWPMPPFSPITRFEAVR